MRIFLLTFIVGAVFALILVKLIYRRKCLKAIRSKDPYAIAAVTAVSYFNFSGRNSIFLQFNTGWSGLCYRSMFISALMEIKYISGSYRFKGESLFIIDNLDIYM